MQNGKEAVGILKSYPVEFVLTDLNMPEMDGYELLRYLRKNYPEMLVFAMTSDLTPEVEERLCLMDVKQPFEKPFGIRMLALKIAAELISGAALSVGEEKGRTENDLSFRRDPKRRKPILRSKL
jgi:CheY-like chemotaxis protein